MCADLYAHVYADVYNRNVWRDRYSVSYTTCVDSARRGAEIMEHKLFISVGHDEYWSQLQRAAIVKARDIGGVSLAFMYVLLRSTCMAFLLFVYLYFKEEAENPDGTDGMFSFPPCHGSGSGAAPNPHLSHPFGAAHSCFSTIPTTRLHRHTIANTYPYTYTYTYT